MTASSAAFSTRRTPSDGFIIVAVLWILGALATLVSIYAVYVVDTAGIFGAFDDRLRAEQLVSAALELTAYRLRADPRPSYGRFEFRMGQANVAAEFRSETARIDLNAAPKDLIIGLLAELGVPRDATVVAVIRERHVIVPRGETTVEPGDEVLLLVTPESEDEVKALLVGQAAAAG